MTGVSALPYGRPLTRSDLDGMPDDGHRYELLDGVLIVSPSPRALHQRVVANLLVLLREAAPVGMEVFTAPLDVVLADDTVLQPDVLVTPRVDLRMHALPPLPLLAVEVLSPSTRAIDLLLKRSRLERAGVLSYWVVDPDVPQLRAWDLQGQEYVEVGDVSGGEPFVARAPYAVTIVPNALIGR